MTPWYLGNSFSARHMWGDSWWWGPGFIVPLAAWSLVWTGLALWHAARREDKGWFLFFLLVHTAGIIEIIYLIFVAHAFGNAKKQSSRKRRSS